MKRWLAPGPLVLGSLALGATVPILAYVGVNRWTEVLGSHLVLILPALLVVVLALVLAVAANTMAVRELLERQRTNDLKTNPETQTERPLDFSPQTRPSPEQRDRRVTNSDSVRAKPQQQGMGSVDRVAHQPVATLQGDAHSSAFGTTHEGVRDVSRRNEPGSQESLEGTFSALGPSSRTASMYATREAETRDESSGNLLRSEDLIKAWQDYRENGDGLFNPGGFQQKLRHSGINAEVVEGNQLGLGSRLVGVTRGNSGRYYLLPDFTGPLTAITQCFDDHGSGDRTRRVTRVTKLAVLDRRDGKNRIEKGVVS